MNATTTQLLSSSEFCKLRYDTIPVNSASANISFYTNNSKMSNFELWHFCCKWAICIYIYKSNFIHSILIKTINNDTLKQSAETVVLVHAFISNGNTLINSHPSSERFWNLSFSCVSNLSCHQQMATLHFITASCQQTCMTYTIAVCTVKNSWRWTEELSETCRVLFQE